MQFRGQQRLEDALHQLLPLEWSQHNAPNYSKNTVWFQDCATKQMRSVLFSVITQCIVVIPYWRSRTTYWFHLQGSTRPIFRVLTTWPLKIGTIGCPKTSVTNYHYMLSNNPDECRFQTTQCYIWHGSKCLAILCTGILVVTTWKALQVISTPSSMTCHNSPEKNETDREREPSNIIICTSHSTCCHSVNITNKAVPLQYLCYSYA
jgi:hypothetical protein